MPIFGRCRQYLFEPIQQRQPANLEDGLQQMRDEFTTGGQAEGTMPCGCWHTQSWSESGDIMSSAVSDDESRATRKADVTALSAVERKVTGQVEEPGNARGDPMGGSPQDHRGGPKAQVLDSHHADRWM
eukprot:Skav231831  [mRNA]  locus=scaffold4309:37881:39612:+ [translate_table: standard]